MLTTAHGFPTLSLRVFAALLLALAAPLFGQENGANADGTTAAPVHPDTSEWHCGSCPFDYALNGDVLLGLGHVSEDFREFGNFGGYEDEGPFPVLGVDLLYRDQDARYLDVYGDRLGLDSRALYIEGGRQGDYSLWFTYEGIPYVQADDARTVMRGAGTASQALPGDWITADRTGAMPRLQESLRDVTVGHERETVAVGLAVDRPDPWRYRLDVGQTRKEGSLIRGGSFVFRSTQLMAPVDYETTRVEAAVAYVQDRWQLEAAYNVSVFDNANESLRWENPFTPINGASQGELAQPPDSQSHQLMLSGSWYLQRWLTVAGQVAVARLEQDEPFLEPSLNAGLGVIGLPRSNLDGEVTSRVANLRLTGNFTGRLGATAEFRYDERDNETPRDAYLQVVTDAFLTGERVNEPYSYERQSAKATLDYRAHRKLKLSASAGHETMERTFQEVKETETDSYSVQARFNPVSDLNLRVELSREERDNDLDPDLLGPWENPSLRRFHFADRERDALRLSADYAITDRIIAGLFVEAADEDFSDTRVGLSEGRDESYGLDLSAIVSENVSAHAFVAVESLEADLRGADVFDPGDLAGTPWRARQDDELCTVGFGVEFRELPGQWVRGALEFTYASADGEIRVDKIDAAPAFPELQTRRLVLEASAERLLRENMDLRLSYLVGRSEEDDFYRDDVGPDTIPTLLGLGHGTPGGTVHVISAMLRYHFR